MLNSIKKLTGETEIALFPIPGSVALPFSVVSLHVFEPRYRTMIKESIAAKRRIGVAHTKHSLPTRNLNPMASKEEILQSNQGNYLAHSIFSAGFARIQETLPDGRMLIEIEMDSRYEIKNEIQQVPYRIVTCEAFVDTTENQNESEKNQLRHNFDQVLNHLASQIGDDSKSFLESDDWKNLSFEEYSFKIYSIIRFEPEILQNVLELRSSEKRIVFLNDFFTRGPLQ